MKDKQAQDSRAYGWPGLRTLPELLVCAACLAVPLHAAAQVYKWTDTRGTVHYTDTPPSRQRASQLAEPAQVASRQGPALPYELARAAKASPVTLYTTTQAACPGCERGRALLKARGIPYTEKTVDTDADKEQLQHLAGALELPLLVVGSRKLAGFQDAAWQDALSAAAYPRSRQLPPGYQYAPPQAAADANAGLPAPPARAQGTAAPDEAAAQAAEQQPRRPAARDKLHDTTPARQPPTGNAPPGFQF